MARWLFLILLMLNLLLFIWGYQRTQPQTEPLPPLPNGAPTIQLLAELDAQTQKKELERKNPEQSAGATMSESSAASSPVDIPAQAKADTGVHDEVAAADTIQQQTGSRIQPGKKNCVRLGPVGQREAAKELVLELSKLGHEAVLQVEFEQRQNGYWVLIPPGSEDPDFLIANLKLEGIQDLWRFTKGELDGAVSLGLYSAKEQARERLQELQEKGFDAEIRSRTIQTATYWVRSRIADEDGNAALEPVYNKFPWLGYPPKECPAIASP